MEKQIKILSLCLVSLLMLSALVYAAGSSTGNPAPTPTPDPTPAPTTTTPTRDPTPTTTPTVSSNTQTPRERIIAKKAELKSRYQNRNCEGVSTKRERISCRLAKGLNYKAPVGTLPEACRKLGDSSECRSLYKNIGVCFEKEGRNKDKCFKRVAGFTKAKIKDETLDRQHKTRMYVVAVLYDLQERVENAHENNKIDSDEATVIIDKIVNIKQKILDSSRKSEIKPMIQELRQLWRQSLSNE